MTGMLLFLLLIAPLVVALEVRHRRSLHRQWFPGRDTRLDRDAARLEDDLRAAAQREPAPTQLRHDSARPAAHAAPMMARTAA